MDHILHSMNPWWAGDYIGPGTPRERYLSRLIELEGKRDIVLITGLRRVGKTTLMYQLIGRLMPEVDPRHILYVSLDNLALRDHTIGDIVEAFRRMHSLRHDEKVHLFLDEVHFRQDWELELKNLYDLGHAKVYGSGSASLDMVMRSPNLTGRQRMVRVSPLSFGEFLKFTGERVSPADRHLYPPLARRYIETGGMPEYVLTGDPNVLQALIDSILYRDIAGRHGIRNRENLKDILILLAQSVGTRMSFRKAARVLGVKEETVGKVIALFVESNLVHIVEKEGRVHERKASPRKFYLADTGMFTVLTDRVNPGVVVENLVFLTLARKERVRYRYVGGMEVDFVRGKDAFESKYRNDITDDDLRPLASLRGFSEKMVITDDLEEEREGVRLVPLWKFLLENDDEF